MIEIRELVKTFDGFAALDGASLTVPQGAIYGLVGPNGAGKSTLLRHLTGVYRQDSGTVSVDGADVWRTWRSSSASPPFQTTGTILCSRASAT